MERSIKRTKNNDRSGSGRIARCISGRTSNGSGEHASVQPDDLTRIEGMDLRSNSLSRQTGQTLKPRLLFIPIP
jgi:hypothetical protein